MAILLLLFVIIHFTIGEIPQLEPFSTFLDHVHRITEASELGLQGHVTRDEGLYSPHEEKDDGASASRTQALSAATQFRDLPHEIYKSTEDDDAYFITFHEFCNNKLSADDEHTERMVERGTAAPRRMISKVKRVHSGGESKFYEFDGENSDDHQIIRTHQSTGNRNGPEIPKSIISYQMADSPSNYREEIKSNVNDEREILEMNDPIELSSEEKNAENVNFSDERKNRLIHSSRVFRTQHEPGDLKVLPADNVLNTLHSSDRQNVIESDGEIANEYGTKAIPKVKLMMKDRPKTLDVRIDLNSLKDDHSAVQEKEQHMGLVGGELDGISLDEGDPEVINNDEAKSFLKDKISNQIQMKEEELMGKLGAKPSGNQLAGSLDSTNGFSNLSKSSKRNPRAVDMIDRSITYTEHERTMKQEVEVTYKRAQDIAKAILKTSEAIANSLDLCRKPISTNFLSDEPLTEAENIIDQIVGQLKESLELTMGCRTCVKPHKDLMLFLRWLIFDDVSIKLCPSKPKAADLRKNYLLFNHDNMFPGRVCQANEFPKAPFNCSASGEMNAQKDGQDDGKPDDGKISGTRKKGVVSKRRHKNGDKNTDSVDGNSQKNARK